MQPNKFFQSGAEVTPANLGEAIQQAIEIEIATIPVYLYTYYSLNRVPNQDALSGSFVSQLTAKGMPLEQANKTALDLSAQIMVYANKAGATIISIVIEEMLHMSLSSNLKQALRGMPSLIGKSPSFYPKPAELPGHEPEFPINLAPFSLDQLITFLLIESPQPLQGKLSAETVIPYTTIGEFYGLIESCIKENDLEYQPERPQLVPARGYYATNNIDTVYYTKEHKPQFVDADDSGDLIYVVDRDSAVKAIHQIVEQGEGNTDATGLNPDGSVNCGPITSPDFDDPAEKELSHFAKFNELYCEYQNLQALFNSYGLTQDIGSYFVMNFPTNPTTARYPNPEQYPAGTIQALSELINGIYSYIFVMTEGCYRNSGNTQYEIFMFGIHKSMIFILSSLCGEITALSYFMNGQQYVAAPTFENYPFGLLSSPKSQLIQLYNNAVALYPGISYLGQRFQDLPDVSLN